VGPPRDFPSGCSFALQANEAAYLADRIRASCPGTLLATLIGLRTITDGISFVWDHPRQSEFTESQSLALAHARNFSEIMHGAELVYHWILSVQTGRNTQGITELYAQWNEDFEQREGILRTWSREEFWSTVEKAGGRVALPTRKFVGQWWDLCLSVDRTRLYELPAAVELIRQREKQLKRQLARIDNPRAAEIWSGTSGLGRLNYRWGITQRLVNDIVRGLKEEKNA
jgi:hypothetical protein